MKSDKPRSKDEWARFERAVDVALKTRAKHKEASRKSQKKKAKPEAR